VTTYAVVFTPEATEQLVSLYEYIATHGSPAVAANYTEAIIAYCEGLSTFPHRGTRRDDIRSGLRITNYKRRAVIAFEVDDHAQRVSVLGVFYGGRDYERALGDFDEADHADAG
jgi:plasmid stabilization system protein ParE